MQLNQSTLTIQSIDILEIGSKVVFIGDDPFAPESWANYVQTVVEIEGDNILAHQKDSDRHRELRKFSDFRLASVSESESGNVNHAIDGTHADLEDDEDVQDVDDMGDDENLGISEDAEPEEPVHVGVAKVNDWGDKGMSNSLMPGILVVALDEFDSEIVNRIPTFDVNNVYQVLSVSKNTDTIMLTDNIKLPARMFRYPVSAEFAQGERIKGLEDKADGIVRDALQKARECHARITNEDALTNGKYPKWVSVGLVEEMISALTENETRLISYLNSEMELVKNGKASAPVIGWEKFAEIESVTKYLLERIARELLDANGEYIFGRIVQYTLGTARESIQQGQKVNIEILREAEMEAYGGRDAYLESFKNDTAFTSLFDPAVLGNTPLEIFELSDKQLRLISNIIMKVIGGEPLSAVNVLEGEWDLKTDESSQAVQRYINNRYIDMCKDVVIDMRTQQTMTNVYQSNAITFVNQHDTSKNFNNINSHILAIADAPYLPKSIFVYVDNNNMLVVPKVDVERLRPDAHLIGHNGEMYKFIDKDGEYYTFLNVHTATPTRISETELTRTRILPVEELLSHKIYGKGINGVIDKDIEYPQYFVSNYGSEVVQ